MNIKTKINTKTLVAKIMRGTFRVCILIFDNIYDLPSGKLTQLWNITMFNRENHYKWSFSMAMLLYQRV